MKKQEFIVKTIITANSEYAIRREAHNGTNYIIVPVVMMVEGVHTGNHGPLLHLAEELGAFPEAWNGIPVTIDHPERDGQFVSANSPEIISEYGVGRVFSTRLQDASLRSEAWIEEARIRALSPEALSDIEQGEPLEVSVGMFSEDEMISGEWNGETYNAIARNPRPDHLALLPGGVGACSWADGCGVRANKKGGTDEMKDNENFPDKSKYLQDLIANAESGYREIMETVQSKLDAMDSDIRVHYLQDVYEGYFIYSVRSREGTVPPKLYKRSYSVNDSGEVEFEEEPIEVRKQVTYVTLKGNKRTKFNNPKEEVTIMSDKKEPCDGCEPLVNELIANERTKFTEKNREWLLTLEEDQLALLVQEEVKEEEVKKDPPKKEEPVIETMSAEQARQMMKESIKNTEDFLELLPDELRESVGSGLKLHKEQHEGMVKDILSNTEEGTWEEATLKGMPMDTLQRLHKSIVKEVGDYSLSHAGADTTQKGEPPLMQPIPGSKSDKT